MLLVFVSFAYLPVIFFFIIHVCVHPPPPPRDIWMKTPVMSRDQILAQINYIGAACERSQTPLLWFDGHLILLFHSVSIPSKPSRGRHRSSNCYPWLYQMNWTVLSDSCHAVNFVGLGRMTVLLMGF